MDSIRQDLGVCLSRHRCYLAHTPRFRTKTDRTSQMFNREGTFNIGSPRPTHQ
jgi:hypothetical protein